MFPFRYLTKRQEEWRVQEKERKELEMNANVPQGYVLLSENERIEHLKTFKRSNLTQNEYFLNSLILM